MHCLFLDLASHDGVIACVDSAKTVFAKEADHRISDHELLPVIEKTLADAGWSYGDLTHVACVTGPGGFTSLRVGVTCANVLAHELKAPLAGVHLSEVYAERAISDQRSAISDQNVEVLWLHSTKKDQLFVKGGVWEEVTLVKLEELTTHSSQLTAHWMGELIPEHRAVVDGLGMTEAELLPVATVLPVVLSRLSFAEVPLEPWYGRGW